ncbi:MAG TPA: prepilin-type N-terminal cleavage/methylation domain-containing protein [Burkholderiales bacterium]
MPAADLMFPSNCRGASLVELLLVMVITGVIAALFALFLTNPMRGYLDLSRRATLVDATEGTLRRMARDIRIALPNSIRITNNPAGVPGFALELIPTVDGGRYCSAGVANCAAAAQWLDIPGPDTDFDILGCFRDAAFIAAAGAGTSAYRLVVNNPGNAVYDGSVSVITTAGTTLTLSVNPGPGACPGAGNHHLRLNPGMSFASHSPRQRAFVVPVARSAVTYLCNTTAGTLELYEGYGIAAAQPLDPAAAPLSSVTGRRVADNVVACSATTTSANVIERGIVTLDLSIGAGGETIRLLNQVQLDNSP